MHALINYHRSDILPSTVERLCSNVLSNGSPEFLINSMEVNVKCVSS